VAIGLVMISHAKWPWVNNGGDAGVTAFFVLSGYVITQLLLRQQAAGRVDVVGFYRRRVVRLGPALLGLLAFVIVVGVLAGWAGHWRLGILSCLVYVSNWVEVAGVSIDPLGHTWSLAIEEQFYLVWPALLLIVFRSRQAWLVPFVVTAMVAASLALVAATGTFEYFSTVTHAQALLLGCLIAITGLRLPDIAAPIGLVLLVAVALWVPPDSHDAAILVSMFAAAGVISGRFRRLARLAPAGLRAYSLYLWNWPMTILFGTVGFVAPLLTVLVGELSFRLLEAPVLNRGGHRAVAPEGLAAARSTSRPPVDA
jgi:peptidoglycan/LPS O-acetylase OafA/YrhL